MVTVTLGCRLDLGQTAGRKRRAYLKGLVLVAKSQSLSITLFA